MRSRFSFCSLRNSRNIPSLLRRILSPLFFTFSRHGTVVVFTNKTTSIHMYTWMAVYLRGIVLFYLS